MTDTRLTKIGQHRHSVPRSVAQVIIDVAHPDIPWQAPDHLPPLVDIREAVRILGSRLEPCPINHAKRCFADMLALFEPNTRANIDEMRLRFASFFDTTQNIPEDLWTEATAECKRKLKWFPKPVEFWEQIQIKYNERELLLQRARGMTETLETESKNVTFIGEPLAVRVATLLRWARASGDHAKVARYEAELAVLEGREPPEATLPHAEPQIVPTGLPAIPVSPQMQRRTAKLAEEWHRREGRNPLGGPLGGG